MTKKIKVGTQVILFGEDEILSITGIYKLEGKGDELFIEGFYDADDIDEIHNIPFSKIYAIITPLSIKDQNIEQVRLISEIDHGKRTNN